MIPGLSPSMMKKLMKQMNVEEVPAKEVIIKTPEKTLRIKNPKVTRMNVMGQETYQIMGNVEELVEKEEPEVLEEDVKLIMEKTGASKEEALKALRASKGDLAEAIIKLKK